MLVGLALALSAQAHSILSFPRSTLYPPLPCATKGESINVQAYMHTSRWCPHPPGYPSQYAMHVYARDAAVKAQTCYEQVALLMPALHYH